MANGEYIALPIHPKAGVQRDGTHYLSDSCVDAQWCRFYLGLPRKIGGYKLVDKGNETIVRSLYSVAKPNNSVDVYVGRYSQLTYFNLDFLTRGGAEIDRTPVGFTPYIDFTWGFDLFTSLDAISGTSTSYIVAVPISNLTDSSTIAEGNIYYGETLSDDALIPLGQTTSGGIVNVQPFLFKYGNNGVVNWCAANDLTSWPDANYAIIANTKILKGMNARGSETPSVLFWSLNSLIRGNYIAAADTFSFTTVNDEVSLMSPNSVVQYMGIYYWIGIDEFYFYNGIVQKLPNTFNKNWFFNNLNKNQRAKIWGMVIPRFQEIWWFFPFENSTECDRAIIYNIEGNYWYDTIIERSCGYPSQVFAYPIMASSTSEYDPSQNEFYGIWIHEYGTDKQWFDQNNAIESYFETNFLNFYDGNPNQNIQFRTRRIEPDFSFRLENNKTLIPKPPRMYFIVRDRGFPQSTPVDSDAYFFDEDTEKIDVNMMGRLVTYKFVSNAAGGFYQMGKVTIDVLPGDVRPKS